MNNNMTKGFPPRVTLKAGRGSRTWSRRSSFILILDIHDHSLTFTPFSNRLTNGAIANGG